MGSNVCISEAFSNPIRIAVLQLTVNSKCSFDEPALIEVTTQDPTVTMNQLNSTITELKTCENNLKEKSTNESINMQQIQKLEAEKFNNNSQLELLQQQNLKVSNELEVLKAEYKALKDLSISCAKKHEIEELKSTIAELKSDKQNCNKQFDFIKNLHEDLKSQWNETCDLRSQELRNAFHLQQKEADIIEKTEKINTLEKKIEMFGQY